MKTRGDRFKEGMIVAGYGLLVVAALPVVAFLLFVLRAVVLAAMVGGLVAGVGLWLLSARFRDWLWVQDAAEVTYKGLRLATDVAVHPGHAWARIQGQDVRVGADDLVQAVLGPVERVELPPAGRRVARGEPLFRVRSGERSVELRAPVTGAVLRGNEALEREPGLVNRDPFRRGWAVTLRAGPAIETERRSLLRGYDARAWFRGQVDRLLAAVLTEEAAVPVMADGGLLAGDLHRRIDDSAWRRVKETLLAAPEPAESVGQARG